MTQLQLVEVDPNPGFNGLPETRTIKAVSTSWSTLKEYCKETFGTLPSKDIDIKRIYDIRYEIEESNIVIVQENVSKFDK
jgi:hypothetical protein